MTAAGKLGGPRNVVRNASETEPGHTGTRLPEMRWPCRRPVLGGGRADDAPGRQERHHAGLGWALLVLTLLGLAATAWLDALLRQAGQPALAWLGAGNAASAGAAVVAATVGALVASRRPRHPVGWLLVAMGLSVSLSAAGSSYK